MNEENEPLLELTQVSKRITGPKEVIIDDSITEEEIEKYKKYKSQSYFQSVIEDLIIALYEIRYITPFAIALGALFAYQLTIAPYRTYVTSETSFTAKDYKNQDLALIRPVLSKPEQEVIRDTLMYAETSLQLPKEYNNTIIDFKFQPTAGKEGHYHLPMFMYEGVTFSLTATNSHNLKYTAQSQLLNDDLVHELENNFFPKPTLVMKRSSYFNVSSWNEEGVAVYYSYAHLSEQGKLSSDKRQPFKRVLQDILRLARKYRQACITAWYPHIFGEAKDGTSSSLLQPNKEEEIQAEVQEMFLQLYAEGESSTLDGTIDTETATRKLQVSEKDRPYRMIKYLSPEIFHSSNRRLQANDHSNPLLYHVLLQQVIPTRTGLDHLKSTAAVWLSAINGSQPHLKDDNYLNSLVYRDAEMTILAKAASDL